MNHYTPNCTDRCELILNPVPGAQRWPKRLECETHGYPGERTRSLVDSKTEQERPNDYLHEIAPPAELIRNGDGDVISSQY